jgi:transposase
VIGNGHAGFGRGDAGKGPKAPRQHPYLTRKRPRIGTTLTERQAGQPPEAIAIAWSAQRRLHRTWTRLEQRNKRRTLIAVAVARELAGFCWAICQIE